MLSLAAAGAGGLVVLAACGSDSTTTRTAETGDTTAATDGASGGELDADHQASAPDCVLTPEQIEGPFYTDISLARRDITEGKPGSPLELRLVVVDAATCAPIPDAVVDIWQTDAGGLYSAFTGQGDDADVDTSAEKFLRGIQTTDAKGATSFTTIYPGWYRGRTTHIHVKVHLADQTRVTTQLFFPDDVSDAVYRSHDAYTSRGAKDTTNAADEFGGHENELRMAIDDSGNGHTATHTIGIKRT